MREAFGDSLSGLARVEVALTAIQRRVSESGLRAARVYGFALAGSGALIEHGTADRPTDDADWFSTFEHEGSFGVAVEEITNALTADGFTVTRAKEGATFLRITVSDETGKTVEVDLSLDWRRYHPAEIAIGRVLNIQDAAAAKVATIYSRGEARDFIDTMLLRTG